MIKYFTMAACLTFTPSESPEVWKSVPTEAARPPISAPTYHWWELHCILHEGQQHDTRRAIR